MSWVRVAAGLAALGVALGAFGAHALGGRVAERYLEIWRTAVLYHLVHAVALLAVALHADATGRAAGATGALFVAGITLFSGSLYALVLTDTPRLGAVTPLGGLCFLAGWGALIVRSSS